MSQLYYYYVNENGNYIKKPLLNKLLPSNISKNFVHVINDKQHIKNNVNVGNDINNSVLHVNTDTNRVGINTSNPITDLDVNGSTNISETLTVKNLTVSPYLNKYHIQSNLNSIHITDKDNNCGIILNGETNDYRLYYEDTTASFDIERENNSDPPNMSFSHQTISINQKQSTHQFSLKQLTNTNTSGLQLINATNNNNWIIYTDSNNNLNFVYNNNSHFHITSDGQININNIPSLPHQIQGDIKLFNNLEVNNLILESDDGKEEDHQIIYRQLDTIQFTHQTLTNNVVSSEKYPLMLQLGDQILFNLPQALHNQSNKSDGNNFTIFQTSPDPRSGLCLHPNDTTLHQYNWYLHNTNLTHSLYFSFNHELKCYISKDTPDYTKLNFTGSHICIWNDNNNNINNVLIGSVVMATGSLSISINNIEYNVPQVKESVPKVALCHNIYESTKIFGILSHKNPPLVYSHGYFHSPYEDNRNNRCEIVNIGEAGVLCCNLYYDEVNDTFSLINTISVGDLLVSSHIHGIAVKKSNNLFYGPDIIGKVIQNVTFNTNDTLIYFNKTTRLVQLTATEEELNENTVLIVRQKLIGIMCKF